LYQLLREPPEKGSLRESVLLLYVMKQQQIAFLRDLALAQVIVSKKYDVFEDYQKEMFPWLETAKKRDKVDHIKKLIEEVQRGPISVSASPVPSVKSRLNSKIKRVVMSDTLRKQQNDLYKKMGSSF
jgi:hypothetical protein